DLAARTDGFVGADIEAVCREAAAAAVRQFVEEGGSPTDIVLTADHFETAMEAVEPGGGKEGGAGESGLAVE
ncbi:MAG: hypothetical protein PPP58_09250, partial [Natronomonas sp.]